MWHLHTCRPCCLFNPSDCTSCRLVPKGSHSTAIWHQGIKKRAIKFEYPLGRRFKPLDKEFLLLFLFSNFWVKVDSYCMSVQFTLHGTWCNYIMIENLSKSSKWFGFFFLQGHLRDDIATSCLCMWCSWCQMDRELKIREGKKTEVVNWTPVAVNVVSQSPPRESQLGPSAVVLGLWCHRETKWLMIIILTGLFCGRKLP